MAKPRRRLRIMNGLPDMRTCHSHRVSETVDAHSGVRIYDDGGEPSKVPLAGSTRLPHTLARNSPGAIAMIELTRLGGRRPQINHRQACRLKASLRQHLNHVFLPRLAECQPIKCQR